MINEKHLFIYLSIKIEITYYIICNFYMYEHIAYDYK